MFVLSAPRPAGGPAGCSFRFGEEALPGRCAIHQPDDAGGLPDIERFWDLLRIPGFFSEHGGQDRFGNPISGSEFQPDGRLVQYFKRARFEWHPELAAGQKRHASGFGGIYFNAHEDATWLNSSLPLDNIPLLIKPPLSLQTLAFVARSVTLPDDTQKLFVVVQDQTLSPVPGANAR